MIGKRLFLILCVAVPAAMVLPTGCPPPEDPERTFYMSFTQWPYEAGANAFDDTFALLRPHSDMVSFHIDEGVPWPEAFIGSGYTGEYEGFLGLLQNQRASGDTAYLALSSLNAARDGMAQYRGETANMERPAPWDEFGFGVEDVAKAYANYCHDMIARFDPKFFNYGIEATELFFQNPDLWELYVDFNAEVYTRIKARFPNLMTGFSVSLKQPDTEAARATRKAVTDLLPYADFLGVSAYPYVYFGPPVTGNPATMEAGWLYQAVEMAQGKPVAITETGWPAEDVSVSTFGLDITATPALQQAYVRRMLAAASEIGALFVVWFTVADYDALLEAFPPEARDIGRIWANTGLYDDDLAPRPGLETWDSWLATPPGPPDDPGNGEAATTNRR
ncbi:MAG: hypothetical protein ACLFTT_00665 [Candidatus Hydrogenedentota bacterium]